MRLPKYSPEQASLQSTLFQAAHALLVGQHLLESLTGTVRLTNGLLPGCSSAYTGQHLPESFTSTVRLTTACAGRAGEDEGEEEMARRANGLRSRNSRTLSESGGSRDLEDDAQEAMQEMLGAQEWHQVRLPCATQAARGKRIMCLKAVLCLAPCLSPRWQGDE